jgi:Ser/Thr protein kinase RdoA (MazF antagonist)
MTPYNSYVNRVYGVTDEDGNRYIVKYYRPGRWSRISIQEEHRFILECAENEIPVVPPLELRGGNSLGEAGGILFSVFPLRSGRTFDVSHDQDWLRLGAIVGRMHQVGKKSSALERIECLPEKTTRPYIEQLTEAALIPDDCLDEFTQVCSSVLDLIVPHFEEVQTIRIHGDCHRGNILDRMEEGLLLIDFDDMMMGPPVQDLWLLLPGHISECSREMDLLLEGYSQFFPFDIDSLRLVEPLRFMRIIHFLAWCAAQREDHSFLHHFPDWGTKPFWIKEIEDLKYQQKMIYEHI